MVALPRPPPIRVGLLHPQKTPSDAPIGDARLAAREDDAVGDHTAANAGATIGALLGLAGGVALGVLAVAALPVTASVVLVGATVVGAAGGTLALTSFGASTGRDIAREFTGNAAPCCSVVTGSPNVIIEGKPAAHVGALLTPHGHAVAQGSKTVLINGSCASRHEDLGDCGGKIIQHASRTWIGGPPSETNADEAPWVDRLATVGNVGAIVGAGALLVASIAVGGALVGALGAAAMLGLSIGGAEVGRRVGEWAGDELDGVFGTGHVLKKSLGAVGQLVGGTLGGVGGARLGRLALSKSAPRLIEPERAAPTAEPRPSTDAAAPAVGCPTCEGPLGDLSPQEVARIQGVVDGVGRDVEVYGSAARGERRSPGDPNLPIGKGPGTKSDIDYLIAPEDEAAFNAHPSTLDLPEFDAIRVRTPSHDPPGPRLRFSPGRRPVAVANSETAPAPATSSPEEFEQALMRELAERARAKQTVPLEPEAVDDCPTCAPAPPIPVYKNTYDPEFGLVEVEAERPLDPSTMVYRVQRPDDALVPHESPYFDPVEYGLPMNKKWDVLYVSTKRGQLESLRARQGYFEAGDVMHEARLGDLLKGAGPEAVVMQDTKFNATVLGARDGELRTGGYVIVRPRQTSEGQGPRASLPPEPGADTDCSTCAGTTGPPESPIVPGDGLDAHEARGGHLSADEVAAARVQTLDASAIRFSQSSVNGVEEIAQSMARKGWAGPPIDVVRTESGIVSVDNTRVLAAHMSHTPVQAIVHDAGEALPASMAGRFGSATTWGEAVSYRIGKQSAAYRSRFPNGSSTVAVGTP